MTFMPMMNPAQYGCMLQEYPTTLQFAKRWFDVVCLVTGINCGVQPPESLTY
jgi:hypothetical protein